MSAVEKLLASPVGGEAAGDYAPAELMAQNWPRFRGASGSGVCAATNLPFWDGRGAPEVRWKTEVPAPGFNSPIVWGDKVFMSGATATQRLVFCYGLLQGQLLWKQVVRNVPGSVARTGELPEQTGYAPSTMATDGRRVYAIFPNGDLAAFTVEGKPVWAQNLGLLKNPHGHASSLAIWQGRVIAQIDQGEAEQNLSRLYAVDGQSGRVLWQRNRPVPASWATPIVIDAAGKQQILTLGVPWIISYRAQDGTELWRAEGLNNEVTPSPVFAAGLVLAASPNEKLFAIRPDGQGDVTKTHLAWAAEDNIPDIASPVANDEFVFTLSTPGMLTCYDAKDGKKVWEQDLSMECNASPAIIDHRLYLVGSKGVIVVAAVGRQFTELGRADLQEKLFASPAFVGGRIILRGTSHLFCIGAKQTLAKTE